MWNSNNVSYSSTHSLEGDPSLNKQSRLLLKSSPYFGGAKRVPSKLPRKQARRDASSDIPRPNTHIEETESRAKQGNDRLDRADPSPQYDILCSAVSLTRCHWPWLHRYPNALSWGI
jgi:hypothetical protein